ncbi:hypothetical protein FRACYDRAFT_256598 [Fragilariopsis cylindrus CCMP1102]|uniref:PSI domain-containing protein n=1 Tax=Fragilariopsis cylindrus CCMP1102 TaxID=635003 RepID=A0A1E7EJJ9_9STRA|nr:hypothetical protein FRACYDRAFT_256598 [Fragilariopsis cylindrus CCMP1102]|eukprot:OEU06067.1 hypothetical protein FRACYDRAFT_256598 [Fragilariopsis cylindrus CCMP1102]
MTFMIMTKRLFYVSTIIATTVSSSSSSSKCKEHTKCSKCFNINPELNCTWVLLSDQGGYSSGKCVDADNDNDQCGNSDGFNTASLYSCATGVDAATRKGKKKKKKWKRMNNKICKELKNSIPLPIKSCSDHSGDCNSCLSNSECFWASVTGDCIASCPRYAYPEDDPGCHQGFPTGNDAGKGNKKKKRIRKNKKICNKLRNDYVDNVEDDTDLDEQNSKLCQSKTLTNNCEECIRTNLLLPLTNNELPLLFAPTCQWFPTDDEKVITIGGVVGVFVSDGGYCDSKCNKDGNCGVTMTCKAEPPLPKPGTTFPEYGPKKGLTGNEVEEKLSDLYPGLKIYIIEDGSPVTMEILQNRVRVFVDSNDSDVDDDDLGGRFVVKIPRVG